MDGLRLCWRPRLLAVLIVTVHGTAAAFNLSGGDVTVAPSLLTITGAGVTVGVVDTDFDVGTPELAGRLRKEVYSAPADGRPAGFFGAAGNGDPHGTEVAEALGGRNVGMAPEVQIHGIAAADGGHVQLNTAINRHLYRQGIRIFNQSNGVGAIATPVNQETYYKIYAPFVAGNSLFVWSTGNHGRLQPSMTAALPSLYPDLQTGWLAVTAVNAVGGSHGFSATDIVPGAISSYANSCGVAANWCLAAAGDFVSPSSGKREYGTSFAVPVVTAAAALVQQVYPWMNGDLLRQTLLSSAHRMRDTDTYGWGILNPARAIHGPALFMQRLALGPAVQVHIDGMASTFWNAIGGDAGLVKDGSGSLTLSAINTYSGDNRIINGTLNITGAVAAGVLIESGGTLRGAGGRIHGSVVNQGRLHNSGRDLTIDGDYTALSHAALFNDMRTTLMVGGQATPGNSHVVLLPGIGYVGAQAGQMPHPILRAGIVAGRFGPVGWHQPGAPLPPLLAARVSYSADTVHLHLHRIATPLAAQALGNDATHSNSAANIEQAMLSADAAGSRRPALRRSAAVLQQVPTLAALGQALDSLSGQIHASILALPFQQMEAINRVLAARMMTQMTAAGPQRQLWGVTSEASGKLVQAGYASADTRRRGMQFGIETPFAGSSMAGMALSYAEGKAGFDRLAGTATVRHADVSVYARYARAVPDGVGGSVTGAYAAGRIGGGIAMVNVNRVNVIGAETTQLRSAHTDRLLSAYVEAGYGVRTNSKSTLTPFTAITHARLQRGSFQEGGGSFGLLAARQTYCQSAALLGVRARADIKWFNGGVSVQADLGWQHRLGNGQTDFQAAFVGAPERRFIVQGIGLPRHAGWSSLGVALTHHRRWTWHASYGARFGGGGGRNEVVQIGLRLLLD